MTASRIQHDPHNETSKERIGKIMFHCTKATADKNIESSLYKRLLHPEILCGGIALCMMALLILYAGKKSFFSDEVDQLGILVSSGSLRDLLSIYAGMGHEVAPSLFASVAYLWYRLMPFTQKWLLVLPAIAASMGVYSTGMSGKLLGGRHVAVLSSLFACALPAMATTIGVQFRQYAFVFQFASLSPCEQYDVVYCHKYSRRADRQAGLIHMSTDWNPCGYSAMNRERLGNECPFYGGRKG